ncbi:hypothetical protein BEL04_14590 [Mucilaginibacter sp. PPCGB 2223]|uniref:hypothetical protein n=1 Tax=Mucilaginibacter sp. PPCGB 2223 TaxID=1886027 RepID=UPI00082469C7|nr:hypothetical protein [Mucilaginibacter sp. PPCGB 2223]OCX52671.1 hypothetical protein BEL04_14590 [Mucilaginibacter sp. PPCGB 2223]
MPAPIVIDSFTVTDSFGDTLIEVSYNPSATIPTLAITASWDNSVITDYTGLTNNRTFHPGDLISSIPKGSDTWNIVATITNPFAVINVDTGTGGGTGGGGGTPPDDLAVSSVSLDQQESAPGAADGQVTIHAIGSNTPLQYSIGGTTYQSSPVFTGLSAASYVAYVQDTLGTIVSQSFTVTAIIPVLISTPASGGSRWSALFNPIVFGYQSLTHAPGRKFVTEVTSGYDGASNVITAIHAANLTGYCRADISKYLRTLLQPADGLDYTAINYRDANISASYTVRYKEVADGFDSGWSSAGDPFYVTYSAMQIGNKTGGNMQPYVTLPDAVQPHPAKFLNDFAIPHFYTDMPFDLSFIYSEKIAGHQIKLGGNGIDINGNITGALGEAMLLNENGSVLLNDDGSKLLIEKQAPGVLYSKLGVNRLRITQNIPAGSIYLDVFLFYTDTSGQNIQVTESKRLLLDSSPCNGLPYEYLKWMAPSGGWLYYMFIKNQFHELNTSNPVITERFISDYATADSTQQLISIDAQKKITAGKNDVPAAEAEVLATLLYSPKVYRLVDAATNTWQGVIIDTKSLKMYQTYEGRGDFEIAFLLPEVNTQRA